MFFGSRSPRRLRHDCSEGSIEAVKNVRNFIDVDSDLELGRGNEDRDSVDAAEMWPLRLKCVTDLIGQ